MKENSHVLAEKLRDELAALESDYETLYQKSADLMDERKRAVRGCIRELIPDLSKSTLLSLEEKVPGFEVPTVRTWFGLSRKIDPDIPIEHLRIQLGVFLDNASEKPSEWEEVDKIDRTIQEVQEEMEQHIDAIKSIADQTDALRKLGKVDLDRIDPEIRERIGTAIKSNILNPRGGKRIKPRFTRGELSTPREYPTRSEIDSDDGPGLLEAWLLYQLMSPHSEYAGEIQKIESEPAFGGGDFGGAGAANKFDQADSDTGESSDGASDSIESHSMLGAAAFS